MTIVEHLEELRRVLMIAGGSWLLAFLILFLTPARGWLLDILLAPIKHVLSGSGHPFPTPIVTGVTETITIPMELCSVAAVAVTLPISLWQVWGFIKPGLRPVERRFAGPFLASALLLFALGGLFAYFVMPIGLNFLANFLGGEATFLPDLNSYISFFTILILIFGITFELPVVLILLGLLGIVSSRRLRAHRKGMILGILLVSFIITPGADPFTPMALALPLIVFFEGSIVILDRVLKR